MPQQGEGISGVPGATEGKEAAKPVAAAAAANRDIHRIGGASVENLRLKPREATLSPPGISAIKAPTPGAAAQEIRTGLPRARRLHEEAKTMGSASEEGIRAAGFDVIPAPTIALPNHHRITHPEGAAGFTDANLARLAEAFVNTTEH
jgi:hypothetical protein